MRRAFIVSASVFLATGGVRAAPGARDSLIAGAGGRGALLRGGALVDAASGTTLAGGIGSAAFTDDGLLWAVSGRKLGWIEDGAFAASIELPAEGCRLAAGAGRLVVACPHDGDDDLFVLEPDSGYRYLFTTDAIEAFAVTRAGLLIASGGAIVHVRPGSSGVIEPVASISGAVAALCADSAEPVLYVLAGGRAQALVDGRAVPLAEGVADLACLAGDLYLLQTDGSIHVLPAAGQELVRKGREAAAE